MAARNALYAPAHRVLGRIPPGSAGLFNDAAPSFDFGGNGIQDPRLPYNQANSANGAGIIGWYGQGNIKLVGYAPSTAAVANIAAAANVVSGTPMTLVSATGAGITVNATAFYVLPSLNVIPVGALMIDGRPNYYDFATNSNGFHTKVYQSSSAGSRCVSITSAASSTGGNFLISGADIYGYPMTQLLTVPAGAGTTNSTKAFRFIYSVTPQFTDAHNYSVGTADIFGIPLLMSHAEDLSVFWGTPASLQTQAQGTYTVGVTTTATSTTGDVRGTWASSSVSDGTKRLAMYLSITVGMVNGPPPFASLVGVAQA
jgi:hypothetical protein